ncbi:SNF2 family N-terminal domain-containing protein [Neohortaea acidophila]|uniref:SNF2 family N-terminal domain-containing protein n=1 Tax=Neohortaea acidophila TaxID=245834 RepID=A0A6A6PTE7_9PEZI|nr:SNF2 family N-terminal domain-containing protein [Neohortaea acidophila]KAF2482961.1 SNF2 family N-terminal domain-containing protein [Neohortaea acidophila]
MDTTENIPIKPEPQEDSTWRFQPNETISLLSDDEDDSLFITPSKHLPTRDSKSPFLATNGPASPKSSPLVKSSPKSSAHDSDVEEIDPPVLSTLPAKKNLATTDIQRMLLQKQRELADKCRSGQPVTIASTIASAPLNSIKPIPDVANSVPVMDNTTKGSGYDAEAAAFKRKEKAMLKKRDAGKLTDAEEIELIRLEAEESARRRKRKADEAFVQAEQETVTIEDDEDIPSDSEQGVEPRVFQPYQPAKKQKKTKQQARKPPILEDSDGSDDDEDGLPPPKKAPKKGAKKVGKTAKTKKGDGKKKQKKDLSASLANLGNLTSADVFRDTAATAHLAAQPTFGATGPLGRRDKALRELVASIPTTDKSVVRDDRKLLDRCIRSFTGSAHGAVRPGEDGNWRVKGMKTTLKHYQILGVGFMRDRENGGKPRGGIQADEMGLGKTIMSLANIVNGQAPAKAERRATLIVASPALVTQWFEEIKRHCVLASEEKAGLRVMKWCARSKSQSDNILGMFNDHSIVLTTYNEVAGSFPTNDPPDEIIDALDKAAWVKKNFEEERGPLHQCKWLRVVLDEAHAIKNHKSRTSLACRALDARHYWAVTGTPILNSLAEFYPYFSLIREPCVGEYDLFKKNFLVKDGEDVVANRRLAALLNKVMCRRTHQDTLFGARLLELPPPTEISAWLSFNDVERKIYQIVENRFIQRINRISRNGEMESKYNHVFTLLLRLRQLCSHVLLIQGTILDLLEREDYEALEALCDKEDDSVTTEGASLIVSLRNILQAHTAAKDQEERVLGQNVIETELRPIDLVSFEQNQHGKGGQHGLAYRFRKYLLSLRNSKQWDAMVQRSTCCACHQQPDDPWVTSCFHIYCRTCLQDLATWAAHLGKDSAQCTECGQEYTSADSCAGLEELRAKKNATEKNGGDGTKSKTNGKKSGDEMESWIDMNGDILSSTKTIAIKAQLLAWKALDPSVKVIVYTQFLPMIRICERMCLAEGFEYCTYAGNMTLEARDKAIEEFGKSSTKNVLLASLRSGGLGLNLTMASRVLNVDSWFNRSLEQQAFCRVFRIGQTKETTFTRLYVKGTVDARMHEIKKNKDIEIDDCLGTHQRGEKMEVHELMKLFGTVENDEDGRPFIHPNPIEEIEDED